MSIDDSIEALARALELYCYERGLPRDSADELQKGLINTTDRRWLQTYERLLDISHAIREARPPGAAGESADPLLLGANLDALNDAIARRDFGSAVLFLNSYYIGRLESLAASDTPHDKRADELAGRLRLALTGK